MTIMVVHAISEIPRCWLAIVALGATFHGVDALAQSPQGKSNAASQQSQKSGTGFVVSPHGHILTNAHVVDGCSEVVLFRGQATLSPAKIIAKDERNDLALILSAKILPNIASFRRFPIRAGDDIVALGYPYRGLLASEVNVSSGIVSALAGLLNDSSQLQISAPVQPGNSGGPILDRAGAVAGVVVSKLDALAIAKLSGDVPQNVNFGIKGELAAAFLRGNAVEPRMQAEIGRPLSVADIAESGKNFTVLIECDPGRMQRERAATEAAVAVERQRILEAREAEQREAQRRTELAAAETAKREARERDEKRERDKKERQKNEAEQDKRDYYSEQTQNDKYLRFAYPLNCQPNTECTIASLFDHDGVDFMCRRSSKPESKATAFSFTGAALTSRGVELFAAASGVLAVISESELRISHGGGWWTIYRTKGLVEHLKGGQRVTMGDRIGTISNYPNSPGLEFTVERVGISIDPFRENQDSACQSLRADRWARGPIDKFSFTPKQQINTVTPSVLPLAKLIKFGITEETANQSNFQAILLERRVKNPQQVMFVVEVAGLQSGDYLSARLIEPSGKEILLLQNKIEETNSANLIFWRRLPYPPYLVPSGEYKIIASALRGRDVLFESPESFVVDSLLPSSPKGSERMTNEGLQKN